MTGLGRVLSYLREQLGKGSRGIATLTPVVRHLQVRDAENDDRPDDADLGFSYVPGDRRRERAGVPRRERRRGEGTPARGA